MASKATSHFVMQRLTAMIQVPLVIWLAISTVAHARDTHAEFMDWVASPVTAVLLIVLILSISYHFRLGLGEVADDYVHEGGRLKLTQGLIVAYAAVIAVVSLFSVIAITLIA
ncbi:succinate dehydrogenase, hydrophobic membrane anchor protein [Parvularcula dongshanensis]|uniref:Succinate dehydrogenase hydrophobic membrane anchor subunit n=1 Tax=Parvularcula dongshanensis TaxID=1173995 RepID=A0A840I1P0_9PROT|nr:succinate dehydrogenase, hydrophobic membrane anchor protein [Parvularcula dongshanensis]MBB4658108.1 succinate dehydrogenase / fumarate reductase membrane anchor subunit [Parvularcula dongshanensis]